MCFWPRVLISLAAYNVQHEGPTGMQTADVVIVGGGIVGASIAWHLTEAGCRNVLLVEREAHQGKGSTGKSMGGVRAQFATRPNIQMSLYSIPFYAAFDERLGQPGGYRDQGYLFVATQPKHLEYLETNQKLQKSLGLKQARMISRDDIAAIVPQLRNDDVLGGSFCPTDGFVDPYSVMVGFTDVRLRERRDLLALDRSHRHSARRQRHHRRGNLTRPGQHAGRRECRRCVGCRSGRDGRG